MVVPTFSSSVRISLQMLSSPLTLMQSGRSTCGGMRVSDASAYVAQGGDTFDSIALVAYNEERMASTIIEANPDLSDVLIFEGGEAVRIPIVETVETPETLPPWRR